MRHTLQFWSIIALTLTVSQPAFAAPAPVDIFQQVWERFDRPVAEQRAGRSWTWGPAPITDVLHEDFSRSPQPPLPDGKRTLQYYDKGRMEINDPDADPTSPWFVTSGLLPIELMTGRKQTGFKSYARWRESYLSAIGDPGSFPAYPDLLVLYERRGTLQPNELGKPVTDFLNPDLTITRFTGSTDDPATVLVSGANDHGVPRAFVDFQSQHGLTYVNGRLSSGPIYDPLYIFGLPVTPPVWVRASIGGVARPILFQVFERRVLSYNPANPPAFRVEMGNVGQHSYRWLTDPDSAREWQPVDWHTQTVQAPTDPWVMYTLEVDRIDPTDQPGPPIRQATYRIYASPDGGASRELRFTGSLGPGCWTSLNVALLVPHNPRAAPERIGLATQCTDNPSAGRGAGVRIQTSYDGARTFIVRGGY